MKLSRLIPFAVLMGMLTASGAYALPTVTVAWEVGHSPTAGEFILTTSDIGTFNSFCVETDEFLNIGGTYYYSVSDHADNGGVNTNANDALSLGTAWLYSQFRAGTLTGYDHNDGDDQDQVLLQNAIWMLEGEIAWNGSNVYLALAASALGGLNQLQLQADAGSNNYGVAIMNLWTNANGTGQQQDQLMLVPDGGTTLTLLGLAFGGLAMFSRRARKA